MKIVVCWEHSGEEPEASRIAGMVRRFLRRFNIEVLTSSLRDDGTFGPYRNDAECLAAEAQRLLEAQEAAFGEHVVDDPLSAWTLVNAVNGMHASPNGWAGTVQPFGATPHDRSAPHCKARGQEPVNPNAVCQLCESASWYHQTIGYGGAGGGGRGAGGGVNGVGQPVFLGDHLRNVKFYGVVSDSGDAATIEAVPGTFSEDGAK